MNNRNSVRSNKLFQGSHRFVISLHYAIEGVTYTMRAEENMKRHFWVFQGLTIFVFLFRPNLELVALSLVISGAVIAMEHVNTAIERVVDLAAQNQRSELAKIAKDTSAGAVLVMAITALSIAVTLVAKTYPWHIYIWSLKHLSGVILILVVDILLWIGRYRRVAK